DALAVDDADRHHLSHVLRLRPGEEVTASDGRGRWRRCRFVTGGVLEPDGAVICEDPLSPPVAIGFVVTKGSRPEWVVQKWTELACGLPRVGLGPNVLRAETAGLAAGVLLCALRAGLVNRASVATGTPDLGTRGRDHRGVPGEPG